MEGKLNGFGRIFNANGSYYVGMNKNNKRHGRGRVVNELGLTEEGIFKDGELVIKNIH